MRTGELKRTYQDLRHGLAALAFSPDGRTLATGTSGPIRAQGGRGWVASEMRLWDVGNGTLLRSVEGPSGAAVCIAFSPDGKRIASCDHQVVTLTDADTGKIQHTLMTRKLPLPARP